VKQYRSVLELAAQNKLPTKIDDATDPSASLVQELLEAGYLWAIDASSFDGPAYLNARITLPGREYLARLQSQGSAPEPDFSTGWPRVIARCLRRASGWLTHRTRNSSKRSDCFAAKRSYPWRRPSTIQQGILQSTALRQVARMRSECSMLTFPWSLKDPHTKPHAVTQGQRLILLMICNTVALRHIGKLRFALKQRRPLSP
jgi:hypothetical protein